MRLRTRSMTGRAIAAAATLAILVTPIAVSTAEATTPGRTGLAAQSETQVARPALRVMTRNLYLGVDIMRPLEAIAALPPGSDMNTTITALGNASDEAWDIVEQTNFDVRSQLLAAEIAAAKPDLVGLQEVALWRHGTFSVANVANPSASVVDLNFLKMLREDLRAIGSPYRPVSVNWLSDVEAPAFKGTLGAPDMTDARNIRVTMRDVILKRVGSDVRILKHRERPYSTNLPITIAGIPLNFTRGFQWVDVERYGKPFRFINTHLEAFSSDIAYEQAKQLLDGPGDLAKTTIFVCDCNSDPLNESVKTSIGDERPHSDPYWLITGQRGFHDTWLQWAPARLGWTSGLSELVNDDTAAGFDHRIDMVFARTGDGRRLRVVGGDVTGNTVDSRDPATGLWPSDHAGVVMRLRRLG